VLIAHLLEIALSECNIDRVYTDYHVGSVILHGKNDQLQPLAYSARTLIKSRSRMNYTELAIQGTGTLVAYLSVN